VLLSMRHSPWGAAPLSGAQLIDLRQQFFDAGADLFALRLKRLQLAGEARRFRAGCGGFLDGGFPFLAQARNQLRGLLNPFFQAAERIGFGFGWTHGCSRFVESGLGGIHQLAETGFVFERHIGQHLAVEVEAGSLQAVHELAVR